MHPARSDQQLATVHPSLLVLRLVQIVNNVSLVNDVDLVDKGSNES